MEKKIREKILEMLQKSKHAVSSRELLRKSGVKDRDLFFNTLDEMRQQGEVSVSKRKLVRPAEKKVRLKATVMSLSKGFAFVRPSEGGDDLFVHGDDLHGAMVGDTVLLKNVQQSPRGPKAEVDQVTEKRERTTTGTVVKTGGGYELIPDIAIRYNLALEKKEMLRAKSGDKVQVSLYRQPRRDRIGARVIKIYGKSDSAKICADAILDQNGIPTVFPPEVLEEAERVSQYKITGKDLKGRLDLRRASICTIDGEDAKDLDDAISVSRTEDGYELGVHIADVSHYVREGSAVDAEARLRGTSVYFADRVIPMLPKELSNGVCSLNAGQDKLTFSAVVRLDRDGGILSYHFQKSVINSKVRGVYSEVNRLFAQTADAQLLEKYAPVLDSLKAARELADVIRRRSRANGTMDLESGESRFTLDENGVCVDVQPRVSGEAEEMIEQLMITANQAAAKLAKEKQIPFVYRVHENPDPHRVESLVQLVDALGFNTKALKAGDPTTADFSALLEQARGTPAQKVISHQILRTMEKAKYSTEPLGHFGLALADYCHFTSPIRRYPDTAVHRILTALLENKDKEYLTRHFSDYAAQAAADSSKFEVRAMTAERSAEDCYMAEYMRAHLGEEFDGVISGVTQRGVFVELESSAEGFVPAAAFEGADFQFDGMITQVDRNTGKKLTIGQPLKIRVVASDVATGRIDFEPADAQ